MQANIEVRHSQMTMGSAHKPHLEEKIIPINQQHMKECNKAQKGTDEYFDAIIKWNNIFFFFLWILMIMLIQNQVFPNNLNLGDLGGADKHY